MPGHLCSQFYRFIIDQFPPYHDLVDHSFAEQYSPAVVGWRFPADVNSYHIESPLLVLVEHRRAAETVHRVSPVFAILIVEATELNLQVFDLIIQSLLPILQ